MRQVVGATRPQGQHAKGLRTKELPVIISDIEQQATSSPSVTAKVDDLVKRMVSAASAHPPSGIEASLGQSEARARGAGDCGTALREVPRGVRVTNIVTHFTPHFFIHNHMHTTLTLTRGTRGQTKIDHATVPARRDPDPRTSALCVRGPYYCMNEVSGAMQLSRG